MGNFNSVMIYYHSVIMANIISILNRKINGAGL